MTAMGEALRRLAGFARTDEETPAPADDDQDLLVAPIRRPWTMPFAVHALRRAV